MKKLLIILILFFSCTLHLHGMRAPETAQAQPSSLPKILHKIAYSERVGKFCSWLFKPIRDCCKKGRLRFYFWSPQETSPELGEHPLIKFTKVTPSTSARVARVKKSVAIVSIGLLILFNLPQAGAVYNNLENYLKPTVCVQKDTAQQCCTIENNIQLSCCVTDNLLGFEVCKDYLIEMPETASIPFQDLSRIKDQCSADLTPETRAIRQEFDRLMQQIEKGESPNIIIPKDTDAAPHFLQQFQESCDNIGLPCHLGIALTFRRRDSASFLQAVSYQDPEIRNYFYNNRSPSSGISTMRFGTSLFEYLSVDEIFGSINHELGHVLFMIRQIAHEYFSGMICQYPKTCDYKKQNEEMFADLVSSLLSKKDAIQTSFLRQHAALRETTSHLHEDDHVTCAINNQNGYPALLCRTAHSDNIQNQLHD